MPNRKPKGSKIAETKQADMKAFMNLMVVLIPMLLLSAEFAKIAIIDISLPKDRGSQTEEVVKKKPKNKDENKLLLSVLLTDSAMTIGAKGGFPFTLFYREFHKYIARDDNHEFIVEYNPDEKVLHPVTGREMTIYERYDIYLYAVSDQENKKQIEALYYIPKDPTSGNPLEPILVTTAGLALIEEIPSVDDSVFTLTNPRNRVVVQDPADFELRPLSVYDFLKDKLMAIKERYPDVEDAEDMIIVPENEIIYDKIIQIMDVARESGYPNISLAKFRS